MTGILTGRRVLWIALAAFAVMLTPNIILAVFATRTFSGLVVPNSYVASQSFDARRDAQEALGWTAELAHADAVLRLSLRDARGRTVRPEALTVSIGRPTTTRDDRVVELVETPGGYAAALPLAPGLWRVEIAAASGDGTGFAQSRTLRVRAP